MTPAEALVPLPVSVICYLHLYAFFRFNKRRPGFSVTFMDGLFKKKKKRYRHHKCMQKYISIYIYMHVCKPRLLWAEPASARTGMSFPMMWERWL